MREAKEKHKRAKAEEERLALENGMAGDKPAASPSEEESEDVRRGKEEEAAKALEEEETNEDDVPALEPIPPKEEDEIT